MMDGVTHAIATCDRIERGLTSAVGRAKHALVEMQIELQNMLDAINRGWREPIFSNFATLTKREIGMVDLVTSATPAVADLDPMLQ